MKKYLFITAISLLSTSAFAQKTTTYCDLDVYKPGFVKYVAVADNGAGKRVTARKNGLKDASGKLIRFVSQVQALNYMAQQGWELVSSYNYKGEAHFLLKKVG